MNDRLSTSPRSSAPVALVIALLACAAVVVGIRSMKHDEDTTPASAPISFKKLPLVDTAARIPAAPHDHDQELAPNGAVAHPRKVVAVYDAPDGRAFAKVGPTQQFGTTRDKVASQDGTDTWLPVIGHAGRKWLQVLLPSRPNGSTGWLQTAKVDTATSHYQIQVHLDSRRLDIFEDGDQVGSWPVAVGAPSTPTPTGRTFLLAQIADDSQSYSPVILPLGTHSPTLDSYGGGPGTVALHGWTDPSVFGHAISHGCIRVPAEALDRLRTIPLGTSVLITNT